MTYLFLALRLSALMMSKQGPWLSRKGCGGSAANNRAVRKASLGVSHAAAGRMGCGFGVMCVMSEIIGVTESGTEPAEGKAWR